MDGEHEGRLRLPAAFLASQQLRSMGAGWLSRAELKHFLSLCLPRSRHFNAFIIGTGLQTPNFPELGTEAVRASSATYSGFTNKGLQSKTQKEFRDQSSSQAVLGCQKQLTISGQSTQMRKVWWGGPAVSSTSTMYLLPGKSTEQAAAITALGTLDHWPHLGHNLN